MQKSISTFQAQGPHIIGASAALFPTPEDHEFLGIGRGRVHPSNDMRSGAELEDSGGEPSSLHSPVAKGQRHH